MKEKTSKALSFIRKNLAYLILTLCIIAVGVSVIVAFLTKSKVETINPGANIQAPKDDSTETGGGDTEIPEGAPSNPVDTRIIFTMPVSNATDVNGYSLVPVSMGIGNILQPHLAIDFIANEGENVYSAYDGVVEKVEYDFLNGYSVTIDHGEGLKTYYGSLDQEVFVTEGQTVTAGDKIGTVATSNQKEYKLGSHLHFEVFEKGENVDPSKYLSFEEK